MLSHASTLSPQALPFHPSSLPTFHAPLPHFSGNPQPQQKQADKKKNASNKHYQPSPQSVYQQGHQPWIRNPKTYVKNDVYHHYRHHHQQQQQHMLYPPPGFPQLPTEEDSHGKDSYYLLQLLRQCPSDGLYDTIPGWELVWFQHGYIIPTNEYTMLFPDYETYHRYLTKFQRFGPQFQQYQPQHQQQVQHNCPTESPLFKLPRRGHQAISIIHPTTGEKIKADPVVVQRPSGSIKIEKPHCLDENKPTTSAATLEANSNNNGIDEEATAKQSDEEQVPTATSEATSDKEENYSNSVGEDDDDDDDDSSSMTTTGTYSNTTDATTISDDEEEEEKGSSTSTTPFTTLAGTASDHANQQQSKRIQYDAKFLLQFRDRCTETNADLSLVHPSRFNNEKSTLSKYDSSNSSTKVQSTLTNRIAPNGRNYFDSKRVVGLNSNKEKKPADQSKQWRRRDSVPPPPAAASTTASDGKETVEGNKEQQPSWVRSGNGWIPPHLRKEQQHDEHKRKVNGLLNKLTAENFDSISDQVWDQARQGKAPHKTLKDVVEMVFHKACDQHEFAESWARLCKKFNDRMDLPENKWITDPDIKDKKGTHTLVFGRLLFRRYLLDRCQQQFEAVASSGDKKKEQEKTEMLSDAYYVQVKAKRAKLGLVVFIGELYKQKLLVDNVVKGCLSSLVQDLTAVMDQEVEMVCKLLLTAGALLDSSNNTTQAWLTHYIRRMKIIMDTNKNLGTRAKFMVMDLIDLRKRCWVPKR